MGVGSTGQCNTVGFRCRPDRRCGRGEVVDTRSLASRQPISRLLRAYEDRGPAALPDYVRPVRDLELVGEVPGGKEGVQYSQGVIAFDGGEMPAGWLAAPRWSIRRPLLTSL